MDQILRRLVQLTKPMMLRKCLELMDMASVQKTFFLIAKHWLKIKVFAVVELRAVV